MHEDGNGTAERSADAGDRGEVEVVEDLAGRAAPGQVARQPDRIELAAGGDAASAHVVEVDEVYLSYLPGRAAQVRVRAVGDLVGGRAPAAPIAESGTRHAY